LTFERGCCDSATARYHWTSVGFHVSNEPLAKM
jgi:hypothetical protein